MNTYLHKEKPRCLLDSHTDIVQAIGFYKGQNSGERHDIEVSMW